METESTPQEIQQEPVVSFPNPRPIKSSGGFPKWIFAVVGLVIILAVGGFFLYQSSSTTTVNPTPSPFVSGLSDLPTPTETAIPTKSPSPTPASTPTATQRSGVSIEVQNGTGTTGDAALAKAAIEKMGYTKVTTGNATNQTATSTTVRYSSDVPAIVISEITQSLAASFGSATPDATLTGKMTVQVITGPKVANASPATKATATPTPKASVAPSATVKPVTP